MSNLLDYPAQCRCGTIDANVPKHHDSVRHFVWEKEIQGFSNHLENGLVHI